MAIREALETAWQHRQNGRLPLAISMCGQVLSEHPNHPDALYLMGMLLSEAGRPQQAIDFMRRALATASRSNSDLARGHNNLAIMLFAQGRIQEAADAIHQAVALAPEFADAYNSLGNILSFQGRLDDAMGAYQKAITLAPGYSDAHNNIGLLFHGASKLDEAAAAFRRAVTLNPENFKASCNLATALQGQGCLDEAIAIYRQVLAANPGFSQAHSSLLYTMLFHPGFDAAALWEEHMRWDQQHGQPLAKLQRPHSNDRSPNRRLRIGYVSSDFRDHVVGRNLIPLFREHDHEHFEIICYSGIPNPDALTEQFHGHADQWRNTVGLSDDQLAELIREDQIDILVDLSLHMAMNRLPVFARKPAPLQVTFAGYPGTTGLTAMDYRLTDPYLDPPGVNDRYCSEKPLYLPDSFWCYDPMTDQPAVNSLPALSNGYITFGCLNNFCKINDPLLRTWAQILKGVEKSRLVLLSPQGNHRQRTLELLQNQGIRPDRVEFLPFRPRLQYLELYHRVDLVLDTFPYNGHTTSLDAMWMGVPVVTQVGTTPVSRAGWCQLSNLGLTELAGHSSEEYVEIAIELAGNLEKLSDLRGNLRRKMTASPLMNAAAFTKNIEQAYRSAWRQQCSIAV